MAKKQKKKLSTRGKPLEENPEEKQNLPPTLLEQITLSYYQELYRERSASEVAAHESSKTFDNILLTISAGAIGVSVTFLTEMPQTNSSKGLMFIGWICLALAVLVIMVSHKTSEFASRARSGMLGAEISGSKETQIAEQSTLFKYATITSWLNFASLAFFIFGIGCVMFMAGISMMEEKTMPEDTARKEQSINKAILQVDEQKGWSPNKSPLPVPAFITPPTSQQTPTTPVAKPTSSSE